MEGQDSLITEFVVESHENLDRVENELVSLEENPHQRGVLDSIFRTVHTIKGSAPFLGLMNLARLTHAGESLLSLLRDGIRIPTPEVISALLKLMDTLRQMLHAIQETGKDDGVPYDELEQHLSALTNGTSSASSASAPAAAAPAPAAPKRQTAPARASSPTAAQSAATGGAPAQTAAPAERAIPTTSIPARLVTDARPRTPTQPGTKKEAAPPPAVHAADQDSSTGELPGLEPIPRAAAQGALLTEAVQGDPSKAPSPMADWLKSSAHPNANAEEEMNAAVVGASGKGQDKGAAGSSPMETAIRVDVGLLDRLMNLVGELVLARNQLLQITANLDDPQFISTSQRINLITSELQEGVMKTRMQPVAMLWSKFPRLARDVAQTCKKLVQLDLEGRETELDRTIVEALKDPLTHIIRNAIDHGIEAPDVRKNKGKNPMGRVLLRAFHEGGKVVIVVSDDGAGIDPEKVKAKALQRGLITNEQAWKMSAQDLIQLIFLPGFSTAEQVSQLSGRGVGMDVVKTNLERIGGSVEVRSEVGKGTTLLIRIPLTLAIIPALMVLCDGERYAIPQVNLLELVQLHSDGKRVPIEYILGVPVYRLRGNLLPLVWMKNILSGTQDVLKDSHKMKAMDTAPQHIIVLQVEQHQFGLVVDEVDDMQEIVVKPLHKVLKATQAFSGATIMGDGQVALILDVIGVASLGGLIQEGRSRAFREKLMQESRPKQRMESLLLFEVFNHGTMVLPLSSVTRLEEFQLHQVEDVGGDKLIQYRDNILPLVSLSSMMVERRTSPRDGKRETRSTVQVIVFTHKNQQSIGFIVDEIHDILEASLEKLQPASRPGIQGNVVIQGRVTQVLDLPSLLGKVAMA